MNTEQESGQETGQESEMDQLRKALELSLPLVQRLFPLDVMFALADRDKFIYYLQGKELKAKIELGSPVPPSGESGLRWRAGKKSALRFQEKSTESLLNRHPCLSGTGTGL